MTVISIPLIISGYNLIHKNTHELGTEMLSEKLHHNIAPVERSYERLYMIGLEDSRVHLEEIWKTAMDSFAKFRYQKTGRIFVIGHDKTIYLSKDFAGSDTSEFTTFFNKFDKGQDGVLQYLSKGRKKLAVYSSFDPWNSFIGISIDYSELFAARNKFLLINVLVLAGTLFLALILLVFLHRLIITPMIRLSEYTRGVANGIYMADVPGTFYFELATLKTGLCGMVAELVNKMDETESQLELIQKREVELDEAHTALKKSETQLQAILDNSIAVVYLKGLDGKYLTINREFEKLFDVKKDEIVGRTDHDIFPREFADTFRENDRRVINSKAPITIEEQVPLADSTCRTYVAIKFPMLDDSDSIYAVGGISTDITSRKETEDQLAAEQERLAVTLRSIGDGVITTNIDGRITLVNKVAEELTGWSQTEANGRYLHEVLHIIDLKTGENVEDLVPIILSAGDANNFSSNHLLLAKDGTRREIAASGAPINDQQSKTIGVVLVFRDMTEKVRTEIELLKIRKLESVGILAGGIAHDFNNLLAAILGNISLAKYIVDQDEELFSLLSEAEKASLRAKDLTAQLLTFSRGGDPIKQAASISDVIKDSADFVLRGTNTVCTFEFPENLWLADIDKGQISQVIQNIIINAAQAMGEEGGKITVNCNNLRMSEKNEMRLSGDAYLVINITDNGPGIRQTDMEKIFDPYFTTKEHGSGLGLAVTHSIIKKHNGHVAVTSNPGGGTTFTIYLPALADQIASQILPENSVSSVTTQTFASGKGRVLIMDDDKSVRIVAVRMLRFSGYEVVEANNGEEAIELYKQAMSTENPVDLVIMDLTIPDGMGGKEAVQKLLEIDPDAKVIVASGYFNDPVMANYEEFGFKGAVNKPFQVREISDCVKEVLS